MERPDLDALEAVARIEAFLDNPKASAGSLVFRCGKTLQPADLLSLIQYVRERDAEIARRDAVAVAAWGDQRDEFSDEIDEAHPVNSKDHGTFALAMNMISTRRGKYELVGLINWLLRARSTRDAYIRELKGALTDLADAVFGRTAGDEPNVYADYEKLCVLEKRARTALRTTGGV